jgi:putative PIN family toxin of toxin-antitoxin system
MGKKKEASMKRVVFDTNVLVSAILLKGRLTKLVDLWKRGTIQPVISRETFAEFTTVLSYPKFALSGQDIKAIIEDEMLPFFEVIDIKKKIQGVCRDPGDDMFISAAISSNAAYIVTGDKDLLALGKYESIRIVTPQEYFTLLKI